MVVQISYRLFIALKALAGRIVRFSLVSVPRLLLTTVLPFLLLAGLIWVVSSPEEGGRAAVYALALFGYFGLAGMVAAVRWVVYNSAATAIEMIERLASDAVDQVFDPLIAYTSGTESSRELSEIRQEWDRAIEQTDVSLPGERSRFSIVTFVANWIARRALRSQTGALVELLRSSTEPRGGSLSAVQLKNVVRDKLIFLAVFAARKKLMLANLVAYLLIVVCLAIPFVVLWILQPE